jgi:hypothetical protein
MRLPPFSSGKQEDVFQGTYSSAPISSAEPWGLESPSMSAAGA